MTTNRFFAPCGDGFLNLVPYLDTLDEIDAMTKSYCVAHLKEEKDMEEVTIKNVIFNPPATIVFWSNGDKTVVKCDEIEKFDPEKGMAMAISKHALGNKSNYYNEFIKYAGEYIRKTFDDYGKAIAKGFKDGIKEDTKPKNLYYDTKNHEYVIAIRYNREDHDAIVELLNSIDTFFIHLTPNKTLYIRDSIGSPLCTVNVGDYVIKSPSVLFSVFTAEDFNKRFTKIGKVK